MVAVLDAAGRQRIEIIWANLHHPSHQCFGPWWQSYERCQNQGSALATPIHKALSPVHAAATNASGWAMLAAARDQRRHWGLKEVLPGWARRKMYVWWCDKIFDVTGLWEFFVKEGLYAAVTGPCWMLRVHHGLPWETIKPTYSGLFHL